MKVVFQIKRDDLWNFNKYVIMNAPKLKRSFITGMAATPVLLLVLSIIMQLNIWQAAALIIGGGLIGIYALILLTKQQLYKSIGDGKGIIGEHSIEIDPKALKEVTETNKVSNRWSAVKSIETDKNYIYIFTGSYMAHIIPKRAFRSEAEVEEFLNAARSYWGKQ